MCLQFLPFKNIGMDAIYASDSRDKFAVHRPVETRFIASKE